MARAAGIARPRQITDFDAVEKWIWSEVCVAEALLATGDERTPPSKLLPYYQPTNVMKRLVYRHVLLLVRKGKLEQLKAFVRKRDGASAWPKSDNPFVWGLRLLHRPGADRSYIRMRSKYAIELQYARTNGIRWQNLDFFLAFAGGHDEIQAKAQNGVIEEWANSLRDAKTYVSASAGDE